MTIEICHLDDLQRCELAPKISIGVRVYVRMALGLVPSSSRSSEIWAEMGYISGRYPYDWGKCFSDHISSSL